MKRFTETTKWADPWFQELSSTHKLFWQYLCDNCDNAGVWKMNIKTAAFFIGEKIDPVSAIAAFDGRVEDLGNGYWWLTKFCHFQYKVLTDSAPAHRKVLELLDNQGLKEKVSGGYRKGRASHPPSHRHG